MIYIGQLVSWSLVELEGHFLFLFSLETQNKTKKKRLKDKKPETDEIENEIRS